MATRLVHPIRSSGRRGWRGPVSDARGRVRSGLGRSTGWARLGSPVDGGSRVRNPRRPSSRGSRGPAPAQPNPNHLRSPRKSTEGLPGSSLDFIRTDVGQAIFGATAQECGPLMSWFPQALLYGFWQSHLGRKRHNSKHARAWVSEIIGWRLASAETKVLGLKGDPLNLNTDEAVTSNPDDRTTWGIGGTENVEGGKGDRLSELSEGGGDRGRGPPDVAMGSAAGAAASQPSAPPGLGG